ncbi:MAG: VWA domain-containing protein [Nannocystaceae bacterium]|nr:VWA domain-containing protein [Nannocystaceae bacterium]
MTRRIVAIATLAITGGCASAHAVAPIASHPSTAAVAQPATPAADDAAEPDAPPPAIAEAGPWVGGAAASDFVLQGASEQLVGVWVDVPASAPPRVPLAVALAIDTSGSMDGAPIRDARAAARKVVDSMVDGDLVALVTFDNAAVTVVEPVVLGPQSRRRLQTRIGELQASGGTALHDGVKQAEFTLLHAPAEYLVRRVIVISDGQATVGETNPNAMGNLAEVGMQHGIQVTSLGVGLDYDERTLDAFAVRSSGRLYHLEQSKEMPEIVAGEMELLARSSAAQAQLELVPAPGVSITAVDAVASRPSGRGTTIPLGVMHAGQHRELLVRLRMDRPATLGRHALASVRLSYQDPADDGIERVHEALVRATITDDPKQVAGHEHDRAQAIIAMREASLLAASAAAAAGRGELVLADAELDRAQRNLREHADRVADPKQRKQMLSGADQIGRARKKVAEAKDAPVASKPARSRAAALELNDVNMAFDGF